MASRFESRTALDFDLHFLADLFNRGFEGYFVPVAESSEGLAARLRYDSIDLSLSRVALLDDRPVGLIYVSVRGWDCRIAGMGVVADARRHGVGRRMMNEAIRRTRDLGFRHMVLEVIEQNTPAVELYRGLGFQALRRLVGFEAHGTASGLDDQSRRDAAAMEPVDPRQVARWVTRWIDTELPWQIAADTLSAYGRLVRGFRLDDTFALVQESGEEAMATHTLLVPPDDRRSGQGSRLVRALFALHEERFWRIPARVPEDLAPGFLSRLGFQQGELTQLEMRLELTADATANTARGK